MTYTEKSTRLVLDASVAVQVLMGAPNDVEFVPLLPRAADESMLAELKARWPGRGLRPVGIIGLVGTSPRVALREPLEPEQVSALASAFLAYVQALFADSFAAQIEQRQKGDEVDWLERLYSLPDPRPN